MTKKRRVIVWVGAVIMAVVVLAVVGKSLFSKHEPVYQGKTVEYWLGEVFTTNQSRALQVLKQIGPEGMPALARAFNRRNSSLNDFYQKMYPKLPDWLQLRLTPPEPAEQIWNAAQLALLNNTNGRIALPELIRMLGDQKNPTHQYIIGTVERWIGPNDKEYLPVLIQCLQDTNSNVRCLAAVCLQEFGPQASNAVPALTHGLQDMNIDVRILSARALWCISGQTNPAAVTLKEVMQLAPSGHWAYRAAVYLSEIDHQDTNSIPVLIGILQTRDNSDVTFPDNDRDNYVSAAATLGNFGPSASSAVPALKQAIENGSPELKAAALQALKKIDPDAAAGYEHP